jgi:hypothetical protein
MQFSQAREGRDEHRIVGERREELRRHDKVKTSLHRCGFMGGVQVMGRRAALEKP